MDWLAGWVAVLLSVGLATGCGGIEGSPIGTAGQNTDSMVDGGDVPTTGGEGADEAGDTANVTGPPGDPATGGSGATEDDDGLSTSEGPQASGEADTGASDSGTSTGSGTDTDAGSSTDTGSGSESGSSDSGSTTAEEG
jgi:hypothetical protein